MHAQPLTDPEKLSGVEVAYTTGTSLVALVTVILRSLKVLKYFKYF